MTCSPIRHILDFLFPPRCPLCDAYVPTSGLCAPCLAKVLRPHRPDLPPALAASAGECFAATPYHDGVQPLIRDLKYRGKRSLLPALNVILTASDIPLPDGIDFAVPVPLHAEKERERGFNQAEEIFRAYLAARAIPMRHALSRTKETPPLYGLSPREREAALQNAFTHERAIPVAGRHILLLDDILTTGATLTACARVLKQAGAAQIDLLVLASDRA